MKANIRFYRDGREWYADVPEHTKSENIMVGNANKLLEHIYWYCPWVNRRSQSITMLVSDEPTDKYLIKLIRYAHNGYGANYRIEPTWFTDAIKFDIDTCWLCNVVHTVAKEHPKEIYVLEVEGHSR